MSLDALTMLMFTLAVAVAVTVHMAAEWRLCREKALLYWTLGFASLAIGCALSPLRLQNAYFLGIWLSNGTMLSTHLLILLGVARFSNKPLSRLWYLVFLPWVALLPLPMGPASTHAYAMIGTTLTAVLTLKASRLLRARTRRPMQATDQLHYVLLGHGIFYALKALLIFAPGAFTDITTFRGPLVPLSLIEGTLAEVLLALAMVGAVRHRRETQIAWLAERDPLTDLFNRRAFDMRAPKLLERGGAGRTGFLALVDIDHFKSINDRYGHSAGDRLLRLLSELFQSVLPAETLVSRQGGDEFVLLFAGDPAVSDASVICEALRAGFQEQVEAEFAIPAPSSLSIGAVRFDAAPTDLMSLFETADAALYEAKREGRNRVRIACAATSHSPMTACALSDLPILKSTEGGALAT